MSALAAASFIAAEGVEPLLHVVTRDRNRIALISDCLGASALGIGNILCTSGTHQTLGKCRVAKNVFDIDSVHLLESLSGLSKDASIVGEDAIEDCGTFCLGAVAAPYADPAELHLMRLSKKVSAGAQFMITQPVFDVDRFKAWWEKVTSRGLHEKAAYVAGIRPLLDADGAKAYAGQRPNPMVPDSVIEALQSKPDKTAQREAGIEIAVETVKRLEELAGLRGFEVCVDGDADAALEIIERAGLEVK